MALRVRRGKTKKQRVATVVRSFEAVVRRPILVGALLTVALFAMFAVKSLPSGAVTVPTARRPPVTTPAVSPVTVTVPAGKTPPVTVAPVKVRPVVTPRVGSTPSLSTPRAPDAQVLSGSAVSAPASASPASGRLAATRYTRAPSSAASAQQQLRSVVVRLSQCMSTLSSGSQRMLLLRAGIGTARPYSPRAVARTLQISVAHEARAEHAALLKLQTAARQRNCGSTPAWIHVPARDRLVLVDVVLTNPSQPARATHASRHATASRGRVTVFRNGKAKPSFTLSAAERGFPLVLGVNYGWGTLMWMPAEQR